MFIHSVIQALSRVSYSHLPTGNVGVDPALSGLRLPLMLIDVTYRRDPLGLDDDLAFAELDYDNTS